MAPVAITGWWVTDLLRAEGPVIVAAWILWVLVSICLHELAHGWAAIRLGDRTPIEKGHMTWNPAVHMGGSSLALFLLVGIAWGAMPVDPRRLRRPFGPALVALAGPVMNLALAAVAVVAAALVHRYSASMGELRHEDLLAAFHLGAVLNLVLMFMNLLPIPPLDGSRILAGVSSAYREAVARPGAEYAAFSLLVLAFMLLGGPIWQTSRDAVAIALGGLGAGLAPS